MWRVILAIVSGALCGVLAAQAPSFEVASVKPSDPGATARKSKGGAVDPGLFTARARTLKSLIRMAYGVEDYQVSGGPAWADNDRFDIEAKPAADATRPEMLMMVRSLLAERFRLKLHHETKPVPAFAMTVARNGPKFGPQFHKVDEAGLRAELGKADPKLGVPMGGTLSEFAFLLRENMRLMHLPDSPWGNDPPPVIDQTNLPGLYAIYLRSAGPREDLPPLAEAQLGLHLELKKIPVDTIVIDSAAKPSEN